MKILNCTFQGFAKSVLVLNSSSFSDDLANIFIIIIIIKFPLLVLMADNDSESDNATYSTKARSLKKPRSNSATSYLKCIIRQADGEETLRRPFLIYISNFHIEIKNSEGGRFWTTRK